MACKADRSGRTWLALGEGEGERTPFIMSPPKADFAFLFLKKFSYLDRDLEKFSLETVEGFYKDAVSAGFKIKI